VPKRRRRSRVPAPVWERERGALGTQLLSRSAQFYATAGVVALVLAALAIVGFGVGKKWIDDRNRPGSTAVQVEDTKYSVSYYTERLQKFIQQIGGPSNQLGQQPQLALGAVSDELIEEAIVLRFASEKGQSATDDEVKAQIATLLSIKPDAPDFDTRYQEELQRTKISDSQYRDLAKGAALKKKLQDQFTAEIPAVAESIHYRQIAVADRATADAIKKQIEGGADFAQLAADKSTAPGAKDNGGDAGWAPRGALDQGLENTLFALQPGQLTTLASQSNFYVYQVLEKQADRPVEDSQKSNISSHAYQKWLDSKKATVTIIDHMNPNGTDPDANKIQYAISRVQKPA
jgi:parvulin-like peptidyl-prolyl isomerase